MLAAIPTARYQTSVHPIFAATPRQILRHASLDMLASRVVAEFAAAPCAVVACAWRSNGSWVVAQGAAGHAWSQGPVVSPDCPFDLASVTKPFSALALARLVHRGMLDLSTPLGVLVQEAIGTPSSKIPLELLLAHRSGLDGHRPLYAPLARGSRVHSYEALQQASCARRQDCSGEPPAQGFAPTYSDLGYLLLGEAIARASALALDRTIHSEVCHPLGLQVDSARRWRRRDPNFDAVVVPTEVVDWRGGAVRGAVHDENAWALGGDGMCAHAGLFGTARDVASLGAAVLDVLGGRIDAWLRPQDIEPLLRVRAGGTLRAGFDGKSQGASSAGEVCSDGTFGHLGFTGTSLWIDPHAETVAVLLSNRVHPTRANDAIKKARPVIHDALFRFAGGRCA